MPTQNEIEAMVIRILGDSSVFQKAIEQAERAAKSLSSVEKELTRTEKARAEAMQKGAQIARMVENSTEKYGREVHELNMLLKKGAITQETMNRAIRKAGKEYKEAGTSLTVFGNKMKSTGIKATFGLTLPLVGIGIAAVKVGSDLQSAWIGVEKTVEGTPEQLARVRKELESLGTTGGIALDLETLFNIGEIGGQLGIGINDIESFTKVVADMSVSTNLSAEDAAKSFAQIAAVSGLPKTEFNKLGSSVVALGNNMATTERDIVAMTLRLVGAGTQMGMSIHQITALSASLSSVGINAEAGGTAFSQLFIKIGSAVALGGEKLNNFAKAANLDAEEFSAAWRDDAAGAVVTFLKGLKDLDQAGTIKALDSLGLDGARMADILLRSSAAVDDMTAALKLSKSAFQEGTALAEEAAKRYASFKSQLILLRNQLAIVASQIFDELKPALVAMIDGLKASVKWFSELPPVVKAASIIFFGLIAALGPVLIILGKMVTVYAALKISFATSAVVASTSSKTIAGANTVIGTTSAAAAKTTTGSYGLITTASQGVATSSTVAAASVGRSNALIGTTSTSAALTHQIAAARIGTSYVAIGMAAQASSAMVVRSSGQAIAAITLQQRAITMAAGSGGVQAVSTGATALITYKGPVVAKTVASGQILDAAFTKTATKVAAAGVATKVASTKMGFMAKALQKLEPVAFIIVKVLKFVVRSALNLASSIGVIAMIVAAAFVSIGGEGSTLKEKFSSSMELIKNLMSTVWLGVVIPAFELTKNVLSSIGSSLSDLATQATSSIGSLVEIIGALGRVLISWGESVAAAITGDEEWNGWILDNIKAIHDLNRELKKGEKLTSGILEGNEKRFQETLKVALEVTGKDEKLAELENIKDRVTNNLEGIQNQINQKSKEIEGMGGGPFRKLADSELEALNARKAQIEKHLAEVSSALEGSPVVNPPGEGGGDATPGIDIKVDQKAVDNTLKGLRNQVDNFGVDPVIIKLKADGANETELTSSKLLLNEIAVKNATKELDGMTASFKQQAATISMTSDEAKLYAIELKGLADPATIKAAKEALSKLADKQDAAKLKKRGEQLVKEFATPLEKFKQRKKDLEELKLAKNIDNKTFKAAMKDARSKLEETKEVAEEGIAVDFKVEGIQGVETGTADFVARMIEHQNMLDSLGKVSPRKKREVDESVPATIPDAVQRIKQVASGIPKTEDATQKVTQVVKPVAEQVAKIIPKEVQKVVSQESVFKELPIENLLKDTKATYAERIQEVEVVASSVPEIPKIHPSNLPPVTRRTPMTPEERKEKRSSVGDKLVENIPETPKLHASNLPPVKRRTPMTPEERKQKQSAVEVELVENIPEIPNIPEVPKLHASNEAPPLSERRKPMTPEDRRSKQRTSEQVQKVELVTESVPALKAEVQKVEIVKATQTAAREAADTKQQEGISAVWDEYREARTSATSPEGREAAETALRAGNAAVNSERDVAYTAEAATQRVNPARVALNRPIVGSTTDTTPSRENVGRIDASRLNAPKRVPMSSQISFGSGGISAPRDARLGIGTPDFDKLGKIDPKGPIAFSGGRSKVGLERREAIAKQRVDARVDHKDFVSTRAKTRNTSQRQGVIDERRKAVQGIIATEKSETGNTISERVASKRLADSGGVTKIRDDKASALQNAGVFSRIQSAIGSKDVVQGPSGVLGGQRSGFVPASVQKESDRARLGFETRESSPLQPSSEKGLMAPTFGSDEALDSLKELVELTREGNTNSVQLTEAGL